MRISVVLAAYNKPYHLERALHGYDVQTDRNFEVIVTEDGCSPEVAESVERFAKQASIEVSHLTQEDVGFRKTVALNKGIAAAKGEYLIFTDDDCIPRNDTVAMHRRFARKRQYLVGAYNRLSLSTSRRITVDDVRSQRAFLLPWLVSRGYFPTRGFFRMIIPRSLGPLLDRRGHVDRGRFPGGNSSCFKRDADAVGGFDENMTYGLEDREFGTRLSHLGVTAKRMKNSTFMLHLAHSRPYRNKNEFKENEKILAETVRISRVRAGHLDEDER